ncbi:MAG: VWA domain-containing protein [bacterium]|nr:VWA domain-containing protein [bacterium]
MTHKAAQASSVLLALFLVTSFAVADEDPAAIFGERVEVRVVNVEVVVEDREGNRVHNLALDDFVLRIDGKAVPIGFFSEIADGRVLDRRLLETDVDTPVSGVKGLDAGQEVGTSYLVFIDDYFTTVARDRNQVIQGIIDGLYRLGSEDRMAIVAFDGRKIEMLSSWSQSRSRLSSTLERAKLRQARGIRTNTETQRADSNTRLGAVQPAAARIPAEAQAAFENAGEAIPVTDLPPLDVASPEADSCAAINFLERQLRRVTSGVTATLRSFSSPPGRKVMLVLSGGWPSSAYDYLLGPTQPLLETGECGAASERIVKPMYDIANLLGYTLYPIDLPDESRLSVHADEADDLALAATGPGITGSSLSRIPTAAFRESEIHATLAELAVETGGRAMLDGARLSAFETVVDNTRSYYWLGFVPAWRGDDRDHDIKLDVREPGLRVRYREGFQDLSRSKELGFMVESALFFGELPGSKPLQVRLGAVPRKGRRVEVPLELRIPMDELTMLLDRGRYVARLELRIGSLNENGERNEISVVPVALSDDEPPPPGAYAAYELEIKVKRQAQDLVFVLHDPLGDTILAAATKLAL